MVRVGPGPPPRWPWFRTATATYEDAEAVLHEALQIQQHLQAQDQIIERILDALGRPTAGEAAPSGP